MSVKKWVRRKTRELIKTPYFKLRDDELELPDRRIFSHYYVFDFVDWVNVVPITAEGKIVLIKQYRHAVEEISLEIPGGATDPRSAENPEAAALRELVEETGYVPREVKFIGRQQPNPALLSNSLWSYVALGCEKKEAQNLDEYEEIDVFEESPEEVFRMVKAGEIRHSMVIAALHLAQDYLKSL